MKFTQLSRLFYDWGWQIKVEHYTAFSDYLNAMLKKQRVMVVEEEGEIKAVILFFLTDDYNQIYKKSTWQMVQDKESGHQIYIDKLVCKSFDKPMRHSIEEAIVNRFLQVTEAIYHREPYDRRVIIKRRLVHV